MAKKSRPASKAFLKALEKGRRAAKRPIEKPEREDLRSPEDKYLDSFGHPRTIRAFGYELKRELLETHNHQKPLYVGGRSARCIRIWLNGMNQWEALIEFGPHVVRTDVPSSSIPAVVRNLRGHLQNLEIDIGKFLRDRKRKS